MTGPGLLIGIAVWEYTSNNNTVGPGPFGSLWLNMLWFAVWYSSEILLWPRVAREIPIIERSWLGILIGSAIFEIVFGFFYVLTTAVFLHIKIVQDFFDLSRGFNGIEIIGMQIVIFPSAYFCLIFPRMVFKKLLPGAFLLAEEGIA